MPGRDPVGRFPFRGYPQRPVQICLWAGLFDPSAGLMVLITVGIVWNSVNVMSGLEITPSTTTHVCQFRADGTANVNLGAYVQARQAWMLQALMHARLVRSSLAPYWGQMLESLIVGAKYYFQRLSDGQVCGKLFWSTFSDTFLLLLGGLLTLGNNLEPRKIHV